MMMVMRPFPDTWWRDHVKAENSEENIGQDRPVKDRMVLIVMKDDKATGK